MSSSRSQHLPRWAWAARIKKPSPRVHEAFLKVGFDVKQAAKMARRTAIHEGCHAVCHVLLGARLLSVDIEPKGQGAGWTFSDLAAMNREQKLITGLAGLFALVVSGSDSEEAKNDIRAAVVDVIESWGAQPPGITSIHEREMQYEGEVREILAYHWDMVCNLLGEPVNFQKVRLVANKLMKRQRLCGARVNELVNNPTKPPLVLMKALQKSLPTVRKLGHKIITAEHRQYLSHFGKRLSGNVVL